uniref:Uncharacterized protein n=1 Tax=Ditylenchus dipsaci TaxID=166011 RepID=A0A915E0M9_9BILA
MANNREWLLDDSQYARVDPVNFIGPITYKTFLKQVYAVMVEKNAANPAGGKYVFPILFALLKNKNRATYDKLFGMVKALMPQFTPLIINVDFEQAGAQKRYDYDYEQCIAGKPAPMKQKVYREADKRILAKVQLYDESNLLEYLRGLAHNFIMDQ